jgi:hypothetical protein
MAVLDYSLVTRSTVHELVKRKNWAAKNPGVILVFAIVFTIALLLFSLLLHKRITARRAAKA